MVLYEPLISKIARRYGGRGEPLDDLRQAAMVGLVKAISGFDPDRGKAFISYLLPTVTGEVKRHFRDHTWALHVPRQHQENRAHLRRCIGTFEQEHARTPTLAELAARMELPESETSELVQVADAYRSLSLDAPNSSDSPDEGLSQLAHHLGDEDARLELVLERESLRPALARLSELERHVLGLRFFDDRTQREIAHHLGCSQMHVSRMLRSILDRLRDEVNAEPPSG